MIGSFITLNTYAFDSGSTGADGAFNPTSNTQLQLPPSGIFNFTDVTIPAGVTVTFAKNANNTPVTMLVSGDVTIDGNLFLNGANGEFAGGPGNGNGGAGGPGGFDGGRGGLRASTDDNRGGDGQGPGRGEGAPDYVGNSISCHHGAGASYGTFGGNGSVVNGQGERGPVYGNALLLPLIGGSGGGGGGGGTNTVAPGGGGGGGAILIAVSGTVSVNGIILANGGEAGSNSGTCEAGSGSGGAIRIVATTIQGEGAINASGNPVGKDGGNGRIRLEAENMLRASTTFPNYTFSTPGVILLASVPNIRITSVGGVTAPATPTGSNDVVLPGVTTNPVAVQFETTDVPLGTTITLIAAPERGTATTANSTPVSGSINAGTASANISLPNGNSILSAQTTFNVTASLGQDFSKYAQGEQVEKVRAGINADGLSETTFITVNGKEFTYPSNAIAMK